MKAADKILFREIQKQNIELFEELFHDYYPVLVRYAENFIFDRQAGEDIVQSLFIYLWENAKKTTIQTSLKSYLYNSVKNRCSNYLRNLYVYDKHRLLYIEAQMNEISSDDIADIKMIEEIESALCQLPPQMVKIFNLKYVYGKRHKEIAASLNISDNTIKTHLARGKEKLRKIIFDITNLNLIL